jgi:predicted RNA-binding Zn ribbon-like protein
VAENISTLPILGGHPALDLVNTVTPRVATRGSQPHDHVVDAAALLLWARRAGVVDESEARRVSRAWRGEPGAATAALDAAREVREALHVVLLDAADLAPQRPGAGGAALARLHGLWTTALGRSTSVLDRSAAHPVVLAVGLAPASLVPDRLAVAAMDLLHTADLSRLRRCPPDEGGCGWIVLDHSRNGSRRWCRMADCGAEVKARRLTERRRAARVSAPES